MRRKSRKTIAAGYSQAYLDWLRSDRSGEQPYPWATKAELSEADKEARRLSIPGER